MYPDVKIGQRMFEKCRPYYLRFASIKDKSTCCCRQHVEIRSVLKSCMAFRKSVPDSSNLKIYQNVNELVNDTLCEPPANIRKHNMECINRWCTRCGVESLPLLKEETQEGSPDGVLCNWERYEYKTLTNKDGTSFGKLVLVKKNTRPFEMFDHLKTLVISFPGHSLRAEWQGKQLKNVIRDLPLGHCIAVNDYSENYKCSAKQEIQSAYFQKVEVSLHVTIL